MKKYIKFMKLILIIIFSILVLLCSLCTIDYRRTTNSFERPIFAVWTIKEQDGGSGIYTGIGYTIEIRGNFMPDDEYPGVTHARFFILGKEIKYAVRD